MPNIKKKGYSARDLRDVSDNPELTKEDFVKAKPFLSWRRRSEKAAARTRKGLTGSRSTPQCRESALPLVNAHRNWQAARFAFVRGQTQAPRGE